MTIGLILAALFLPPLAVFMAQGVSRNFWIAILLTCLGYLPGVAFTFYILLSRHRAPTGAA